MLSDEEIKAIDIVKGITEDDLLNYWEGPGEPYNAIQTVLNLLEKQQKLKENNGYHLGFIDGGIAKKYEYQDKIKAKIEIRKEEKENCKDSIEENYLLREIYVLQSLLEKE